MKHIFTDAMDTVNTKYPEAMPKLKKTTLQVRGATAKLVDKLADIIRPS